MSRWDAAARSVPPPLDPRQRQVVEKLAEFRARNGEAFVDVVRSKQSGNPLYAFLDAGREDDPVAKYYLQCVEARGSGCSGVRRNVDATNHIVCSPDEA